MSMRPGARALSVCLSLLITFGFCLSTPAGIAAGATAGATETTAAAPVSAPILAADYGNLPLSFERNEGQAHAQAKFLSRGSGYSMFLTSQGAVLVLTKRQPADTSSTNHLRGNSARKNRRAQARANKPKLTATVLRLQLAGEKLNTAPEIGGLAELPGRSNYFRGNNPQHWISNIPNYQQVCYREVYPGVDLVYYGNQRQLEYDMVVAPHGDPSAIRFRVQGASSMELSTSGDLTLHTANGDVALHKPVLYQAAASMPASAISANTSASASEQREMVPGSYVLHGNEIQFQVGAYDNSRPLVIDPVLSYSTFLGGSSFDESAGIAVDSSGNAYISGQTGSIDFPTTNTIDPFNQGQMVFVVKLNPTGTTLLYSTYLGGVTPEDSDSASGIAIDTASPPNVYVSGTTFDIDFPVTSNGYLTTQPNPNASNVFVSKLNGAGNSLLYSTYLGGTDNGGTFQAQESGNSIAADAGGNAYVTGLTSSDDFPTVNGFQATDPVGLGSFTLVPFVSKINTNLSGSASLVYSTYLGGTTTNTINGANGIATNGSGKVYVSGATNADNFPTKNAFQSALVANSQNAFVSVLDTTLSGSASLLYSTYLGGTNAGEGDTGTGIAVDSSGKVDVTGSTGSIDFPVTANALQSNLTPGSCTNAFVSQIDPTKTGAASLVYSTFLGGNDSFSPCHDEGVGIAADASGKIYVTGQTDSANFPIKNPLQAMLPNGQTGLSAFISQFDPTQVTGANTLLFSTFLGGSKGSSGDRAFGIALDSGAANIFVTGVTDSFDFPTLNPLQSFGGGLEDAFVTRINMAGTSPAILLTPTSLTFNNRAGGTTSGTRTVTVKNAGNASLTISGISISNTAFSQTNTCGALPATLAAGATCAINVVYSPPVAGNWSANMSIASNSLGSPHIVSLKGAGANIASLTSSLNPSTYFDTVTFTATVTSTIQTGIPLGGTVEFFDGPDSIDIENVGSSSIVSGVLTAVVPFVTSSLSVGTHNITAIYSGDTFRAASNLSGVLTQTVNKAVTTTTVTSSFNPSTFGAGSPPTFTATVMANNGQTTPEGTVTFKDGTTVLGTGALDDAGQTTFTPASNTTLAVGHHFITAIYQGDAIPANWSSSTSATLDQQVGQAPSSNLTSNVSGQAPLTVYFTRNPSRRLLILTMTVTGNFGTPTGTVTFGDGALSLGLATLTTVNATTATAVLQLQSSLPIGQNQIVAHYPGDSTYGGSNSTLVIYQSPRPKIR